MTDGKGNTRERALRAVRRVAWLSLATGCGGMTEGGPEALIDDPPNNATSGGTAAGSTKVAGEVAFSSADTSSASSTSGLTASDGNSVSTGGGTTGGIDAGDTTGGTDASAACLGTSELELVACCNAQLAPFKPGPDAIDVVKAQANPAVVGCCDLVAALPITSRIDYLSIMDCCYVADFPVGVCTPWGPPVPPEFHLARSVA